MTNEHKFKVEDRVIVRYPDPWSKDDELGSVVMKCDKIFDHNIYYIKFMKSDGSSFIKRFFENKIDYDRAYYREQKLNLLLNEK